MRKTVIFMGLLAVGMANAQQGRVGVNTDTPNATLDVKSASTDQAQGALLPQVTGNKLKEMTANLTASQNGMITFATDGVATPDASTKNVQFAGYHRLNVSGSDKSWVRLEPSGLEKIKGTWIFTGWALVGRDASKYGVIGNNAVDLSIAGNTKEGVLLGATGDYAVAMGSSTSASGYASTALGFNTIASGDRSTALGLDTTASGNYSTVMGSRTTASGNFSTAMGSRTTASGSSSTALGSETTASGSSSTALGSETIASGNNSIAMGHRTTASGDTSTAMGHRTTASGENSIAMGYNVIAKGNREIALGIYNTEQIPKTINSIWGAERLLVVGNGGLTSTPSRSDAFTILRNAKVGIDIDNFENTTANARLQVNGAIKISSENLDTCDSANEGTIKFNSTTKKFQGCTGTSWVDLH